MVNTAKAQQAAAEKKMHESVGKVNLFRIILFLVLSSEN